MQISVGELVQNVGYGAFIILCFYPILGAMIWFWGATSYHLFKRDKGENDWRILQPSEQPFVTIMIPAHNEEVMLESTITYLFEELNYQNFEVLVLNDGSTDRTKAIILDLEKRYPRLRMLEVVANKGKAHAFNIGTFFAKGDYLLSNDADTVPEPDALMKYMNYFIHDADLNTAAVTANMDVANRTTLLGKSQTVEFSSIVGVIKRSQTAINDSMYAYSGANTLYRKSFLMAAGGFRQDRATEDISIAWDHQMLGAVPRFAPNVIFHMNVPETVKDLFHQRQRWAQGGTEVWLANFGDFIRHPFKHRYQLSMFVDTTLSVIWAFFFMLSTIAYLISVIVLAVNQQWATISTMFQYSLVFFAFETVAGLLQLLIAILLDQHGAKSKYLLFAPLYLLLYWLVNPLTIVTTFWPALKTILGRGSGTWVSPERKQLL